jgi:GxxExxY protein
MDQSAGSEQVDLTHRIIGAAIAVHTELGPGLMESAYEVCLEHELKASGLSVQKQVPLPVFYKGVQLDAGYRIDLVVERAVVGEVKAVNAIEPVHEAQMLSYLRLSGHRVGLLINFHVPRLRDGIKRMVL